MKSIILHFSLILFSLPIIGQPFSNSINLDGIDDYIIVPHHPTLNPENGSWSVAFWLKAANKDQASPLVMKRLPEFPYTQYSYGFGKDDPHDPEPGKRLRVNHIEVAGETERSGHTTEEFIDGNWHHIVFVANKIEDGIEIYVDGILVEFFAMYYFGSWPTLSISNDLWIASSSSGAKIEGPLDELSIWNKALNQSEINQMMHDTLSNLYYAIPDSGLVAYYRFDEYEDLGINGDGADDFRDLSFWGNHADAEGDPELIPSGIPVGVCHYQTLEGLELFPNPATSMTTILVNENNAQNLKIELFDLNCKKLVEHTLGTNQYKLDIDFQDMAKGIYFFKISSITAVEIKKIIIQ